MITASVWVGSRVPSPVSHALAVLGGHLEWAARPSKRRRLAENLAHAVGRRPDDRAVRRLVRREVVNEAHRSADLLWALGKTGDFLAAVEFVGREHLDAAVAKGRGVLLLGVHIGGWELATAIPKAVLPMPTTAIVADDWLAWAIQRMRSSVGLRIAYRTDPVSRLGALLDAGAALVVLGDDASGTRPRMHKVRFCDAGAELPTGGVTLARLYQATIVGFTMVRVGRRRWQMIIDAPIDPPPRRAGVAADQETLQRVADRWTELVATYPDQWSASYPIAWLE